jgi:hypothetical protein
MQNATETNYDEVEILADVPALFTCLRVDRATVPEGLFAYDLRENEDGYAASIEASVTVNHMGTILVCKELDLGEQGFIELDPEENGLNFCGQNECSTVAEFMETYKKARANNENI